MTVALAVTHHDPEQRLDAQAARVLPLIKRLFGGIAVQATHATPPDSLALLRDAGASVQHEAPERFAGYARLGRPRRDALALALQLGTPFVLFCDSDRIFHWAEFHPDELARVVAQVPERDFTVLGRTERAFATHPRVQCETELIINRVFAQVSGWKWDIGAGARGLSRRAAEALLQGSKDETIGNDGSWPLFLARQGGFTLGYIATEGLEFETPDRYAAEVAAAGGLTNWIAALDADPRHWIQRLEIARVEIEAITPFAGGKK